MLSIQMRRNSKKFLLFFALGVGTHKNLNAVNIYSKKVKKQKTFCTLIVIIDFYGQHIISRTVGATIIRNKTTTWSEKKNSE